MASIYNDPHRRGYRVQVYVRGVRRKLWLGPITKSAAAGIAKHLDALNLARDTGTTIPAETRRWTDSVGPRIRTKLERWGLVQPRTASRFATQLHRFCDDYIQSRTDWAAGSVKRMRSVAAHMVRQLGKSTELAAITPGDGDRFARWCRAHFKSQNHAGKVISDAKQFMLAAVKERILDESPFSGLNASQPVTDAKKRYVTTETVDALIAAADPYLGAIIAMARYGGVRIPSEVLSIAWSDVDWGRSRVTIYAPKTKESRTMPLFPEIRPHLETLFDMAPEGSQFVFDRYRSTAAKVYRGWLLQLLKSEGVEPWPDLWRNLRYSRKNDLLRQFGEHVVCDWIGHDVKTGRKHYDRATEQDFAAAISAG